MVEPPEQFKDFLKQKRLEALQLGAPGVVVGGLVATVAAAFNGQLGALFPTLQGCGFFFLLSLLTSFAAKRMQAGSA